MGTKSQSLVTVRMLPPAKSTGSAETRGVPTGATTASSICPWALPAPTSALRPTALPGPHPTSRLNPPSSRTISSLSEHLHQLQYVVNGDDEKLFLRPFFAYEK